MVFLTLWIYSFLRQHSCKWVFTSFRLILKLTSCLFDIYRCFRNRLDNFFQQDFVWKLFSKKTTTWIWQVNVKSSGRLFQIVMVFSECPNFNETIQLSILSIISITWYLVIDFRTQVSFDTSLKNKKNCISLLREAQCGKEFSEGLLTLGSRLCMPFFCLDNLRIY